METSNKGKGGGDQTNEQAELETIQPVDDLAMLNYLHTKNGASTNRRYIYWAIEICDRPTHAAQANG